jgi:hypothetical protein
MGYGSFISVLAGYGIAWLLAQATWREFAISPVLLTMTRRPACTISHVAATIPDKVCVPF